MPRSATVSGGGSVTVSPGALNNNTYWNYGVTNTGGQGTGSGYSVQLLLDGLPKDQRNVGSLVGGGIHQMLNLGPRDIRGGRHTLALFIDSGEDIAEDTETTNRWGRQFIWNPILFFFSIESDAPSPPPRTAGWEDITSGGTWYNCDGFRMVTDPVLAPDPWVAAVLVPDWLHDDYDLRLHDVATGSGSGFGLNRGFSGRPAGLTDAVLVNAANRPAAYYDLGVLNSMEVDGQDFHLEVDYADTLWESTDYEGSFAEGDALRILVYDAPSWEDGPKTVELTLSPGTWNQPFHVSYYDGTTFETGTLLDFDADSQTDWTLSAKIDIDTPEGRHAIVIWRDPLNGNLGPRDFTVDIRDRRPDLIPDTPSGWADSVVPRPAADATTTYAPTPTLLTGDATATWLNYATANPTPVSSGFTVYGRVYLDGSTKVTDNAGVFDPGETDVYLGSSPITVTGGRHTVSARRDVLSLVTEESETNNVDGRQYVWSPTTLPNGSFVSRSAPPNRTGGWSDLSPGAEALYNCDGVRTPVFTPGASGMELGGRGNHAGGGCLLRSAAP